MIILGKLIAQKNSIKISILPISNKFNKIQNNLNRTQELKQNNIIYDGVEDEIREKSKISPKSFVVNYKIQILLVEALSGG